ncbi:TraY domain-containing protein [Orbus mooreae]|uniref:TraY domain-containing protein n=1 Tax=Orbus mooreae TaxID=3074107 RepID=UPI00370DA114
MSIETYQLRIRISQDLKDRLDESAKTSGRSFTAEVNFRLEDSFYVQSDREADFYIEIDDLKSIIFDQQELIKSQQSVIEGLTKTVSYLSNQDKK